MDAVVLADSPLAAVRIAGLSARERAIRVAGRVGAVRVHVVDGPADRAALPAWRSAAGADAPLLVLRADQLVHTPLASPLADWCAGGGAGAAIAVEDLPSGAYGGALLVTGATAATAVAALAAGASDSEVVAQLEAAGEPVARIPYGAVARHAIGTREDLRGAHRLLYRILVKPQDNAITRYLYRPVSFPLTRLLVWTPITPNQVSLLVAAIVAIGCYLTSRASDNAVFAGTAVVLAASYLDCCDGEIARLKLRASRLGAWLDTIIDELSSVGYMVALGWHCHVVYGRTLVDPGFDPWLAGVAASCVTYSIAIYVVYYNIIVAVGSANSQDYARAFDVVPGAAANAVRLRPTPVVDTTKDAPAWLRPILRYGPNIVRRDFISWAATLLAALHLAAPMFVAFVGFGVVTAVILGLDHARLRALRRSVARAGQILETP